MAERKKKTPARFVYIGKHVRDPSVRWYEFWKTKLVWKRAGKIRVESVDG